MAYQIVETDSGLVLGDYDTQENALYSVQSYIDKGLKVFCRKAPDLNWKHREAMRFISGQYKPLIWSNESWFLNRDGSIVDHYIHRATVHNLVAFTESADKGEQDRQTVMKPGVYLTRFFSNVLSVSEIEHWSRLHCMKPGESSDIKYAIRDFEIQDIYERGPESCMSGDVSDYESKTHPVRVYGDSDLSLAYIEGESEYHDKDIKSRALVWTEKKVYGRIYPTPERYSESKRDSARIENERLMQALESAGYRPGSFNGAKIHAISNDRNHDSYVMPYLDGGYSVDLIGEYFVLGKRASFEAQSTNGVIYINEGNVCEHCDNRMSDDDSYSVYISRHNTESWCLCCFENQTFHCHGTGESYSEDVDSVSDSDGNSYCQYYARDEMFCCDLTGNWYTNNESQEVNVNRGNTETWGVDAIEGYAFYCHGSDQYYATQWFNSVDIDGETYEKVYAESDLLLSTRLKEMEQAEEYENIAVMVITMEGAI
jgi:hypothetical protein